LATPTKQELDQINSLLNDIQKKYDQLGKDNPFKGFDSVGIKNASSTIKQLQTAVKGVNSEVRNVNDEFNNTFLSLQSIVGELTKGKAATNKVVNSTKALEDVSSKILSQRNRGIKLDSKELMSMQKKADISFAQLKQNKPFIEEQIKADEANIVNAQKKIDKLESIKSKTKEDVINLVKANKELKDVTASYEKNDDAIGNINTMLDKNQGFQNGINSGLKQEILDRKKIEGSIGITGGLLSSLSKVTGITGIFDIDKIKSDAEEVAQTAIDAFRETDEYISKKQELDLDISKAREKLIGLEDTFKLSGEEIENFKAKGEELKELMDLEINLDIKDRNPERIEELKKEISTLQNKAGKGVNLETYIESKSNFDDVIADATKGLGGLEDKARSEANSMDTQFKTLGKTMGSIFDGAFNAIKSPEAIFTALIMAAGEVNSQVVDLSKSMNVSYEEGQKIRGEFAGIAASTEDITVTTKKLVEAQMQFNEALGLTGKIIPENAAAQSKLTNQLGIGADSATKLRQIAEATGEDFRKQTLAQYETVSAMSAQEGVAINVKGVMDEVGKAGAYGLAQFQGSVVALTEGVAQAKALGLSLDQVNSVAGKLLDFESSINAELQAELLLGKDINLEKARLAALNNDQKTLMEEINREMGTFEDFSNMNRIQQEAMADAIGMSVEGLSESLLMQQYGEMSQKEIVALKGEEVAAQVEMLKTQEAFGLLIEKLQGALTDIAAGPLGTIAGFFTSILGESTAIALVIGGLGFGKLISGLPSLIKGLKIIKGLEIGSSIAKMWGSYSTFMGPAAIPVAAAATTAMLASIAAYSKADDYVSPGYGKRTLSTPEGTIAFNDKDTIVAGTNLDQNTVINKPTTNSMVSNNTTTQTVAPANNAMMEGELKAIKRVLENIATKEGTVSMNGTKFGTVTAMNTYQIQ